MTRRIILSLASTVLAVSLGCEAQDVSDEELETRNAVEHPLSEVVSDDVIILAEVQSPGGSTLAFVLEPSGDVGVLEHGLDGSVPVANLTELEEATPLEVFLAVAPEGEEPPEELFEAHEVQLAARGGESAVPEGFRVADRMGELGEDQFRWYSSCTNISAWQNASNGKPVGPNCKAGGTCLTNVTSNFLGCLPGGGCYPTGWNERMRWSTCNRGTGTYTARLVSFPGDGSYHTLVDVDTSSAGAYYYYWRHVPGNADKWSMSKWDLAGDPKGHFSLWGDL